MLDIHINNLVGSWHKFLKSRYLEGARRQRTDMLVNILLDEVLESISLKVLLTLNGFQVNVLILLKKISKRNATTYHLKLR